MYGARSSVQTLITGSADYANVSQTAVAGLGTTEDPYRVETVVSADGGRFTLRWRVSYVAPTDFIVFSVDVIAPPDNTLPVKFYHGADTYLAGSDSGPAYADDPVDPSFVGVTRNGIYQAFVELTDPWDQFISANYQNVFRAMSNGGDLSNTLDFGNTDNGIGVQ